MHKSTMRDIASDPAVRSLITLVMNMQITIMASIA